MASIENRQKNIRGRKRRSNSDSELVLANYSEKYFTSASPDRKYFFNPSIGINSYAIDDIDISADNQFFNARFTMDTSQMFMPKKKELSFSSTSPVHDLSSDINISSSQNEQNQRDFYESLHNCAVYMESDYLNDIEPSQEFQTIDSTKQANWLPILQNVTERKECVNKMWVVMKEDKKSLLEKGLEWKSGSWSSEEESMLQSNISKYCKKNGLTDASIMIFSTPREKRKEFYRSIAIGLNRPLFAIYRKVLRMYNEKNYIGKYTHEEVEKLAELCQIHGNDWATIGYHLGRSPGSVRDKARLLKCHKKRGKWDEGELKLLSETVHAHTNTKKGESVTGGINWTKVAEKIQTRTEKQCRSKWLNFLNWHETGGKEWNKLDDVELISKVAKLNATNETQIDWRELAKDWCSVRSPQWLKGRWHGIKKNVPNYQHSALSDILDHLQTTYVEQIVLKINKRVSGGDDLLQVEINSEPDLESTLNRNQLKISDQILDYVSLPKPLPSTLQDEQMLAWDFH